MDLFIAKGPKSLHRFGLACLATQIEKLMDHGSLSDTADGLKTLRSVAVTAVEEYGIEAVILKSLTQFKYVNNRLIADLQTTGKVHGGAQLMFVTDNDKKRRSWIVVPIPGRLGERGKDGHESGGDTSPSGAAFEAEWNKEEAEIRKKTQTLGPKSRMTAFLGKMRSKKDHRVSEDPDGESSSDSGKDLNGSMLLGDSSVSPEVKKRKDRKSLTKSSNTSSKSAFTSLRKKLGSIIVPGSSTRGYAKTGED